MDIVGTLINAFVVVAVGAFLTYVTLDRYRQLRVELKGDIARLETSVAAQGQELKGDMAAQRQEFKVDLAVQRQELIGDLASGLAGLRHELKSDIGRFEARMDAGFNAVRSDITALALALGARTPGPSGRS